MEHARGLRPEQKQMFYQLMLALLASVAVGLALHKVQLGLGMLIISWGISFLTFGQPGYAPGYRRMTAGVLAMGILYYVLHRYVLRAP